MANLALVDTGYLNIAGTGTQASTIANSGAAITLNAKTIAYQSEGNIDDSPIINSNSQAVLSFGSVSNSKITVTGVLDRTVTADMDLMDDINDMRQTYGIKLLYYNDTSDGFRDITDSIGATDSAHLSGTIPHLHVRVTGVTFNQLANGTMVKYSMTMMETA